MLACTLSYIRVRKIKMKHKGRSSKEKGEIKVKNGFIPRKDIDLTEKNFHRYNLTIIRFDKPENIAELENFIENNVVKYLVYITL